MTSTPQSWKHLLIDLCQATDRMDVRDFHHHGAADIQRVVDRCAYRFEDDFILAARKLERFFDFAYFERDRGRYASVLRNALAEWQRGDGPCLPALVSAYFSVRGVSPQDGAANPLIRAALVGALLAEASGERLSPDAYHCTVHFREVAVLNMVALDGEEYVTGQVFGIDPAARQIIVAVVHDLFHTGKDNTLQGTYVPYYLEQRSFNAFEPYMRRCGLSQDDIDDIHVGILVTEIKKGADQEFSAHQYLRQAYSHHFLGGRKPDLPPELALLLSDEKRGASTRGRDLSLMCVRMQESDTVASVLDEDSFLTRYQLLQNENPDKYPPTPGLETFIGFIRYIFSDGMDDAGEPMPLSPFYRTWMRDRIAKVYDSAIQRLNSESIAVQAN